MYTVANIKIAWCSSLFYCTDVTLCYFLLFMSLDPVICLYAVWRHFYLRWYLIITMSSQYRSCNASAVESIIIIALGHKLIDFIAHVYSLSYSLHWFVSVSFTLFHLCVNSLSSFRITKRKTSCKISMVGHYIAQIKRNQIFLPLSYFTKQYSKTPLLRPPLGQRKNGLYSGVILLLS